MKILYLCTHNSARSIMAEAFTRSLIPPGAGVEVYSAGTDPKGVHPETAVVMKEAGIDLAGFRSRPVTEVPFDAMDLVVTLCDDARQACPAPPKGARLLHWGLRDPASEPDPAQIREAFRAVRDEVRTCVRRLMFELATDPSLRQQRRS
jgi:arsenate reductase